MADIAELEIKVAALEADLATLRQRLEECCGGDEGNGRPCRSGRPVIVSGYEVATAEEAADLLKKFGF